MSHYVERDLKGFFLFQLVNAENNELIRYFTDEGKVGGEWDHWSEIQDPEKETVKIDVDKVEEISYKAEAKGLKPSTTYYYQVGSAEGGYSDIGQFVTSTSEMTPFTFLHYTDTQNAYWNEHLIDEAAFGADTLKRALETAPEAEFVLHTGDIVEIAEVEDEWMDLFEKSKESFMKTTIAAVPGNHDEYGLNYSERFTQKYNDHVNVPAEGSIDGGSYYSYDYNGVHFVVLNTNDNKNEAKKAIGEEQLARIKKDVEEARANGAQWVILNYHKPIFSKSYHSLQDSDVQAVKEELMKLIDELDIDLALQGHDHVLSRTKSLSFVPKEVSPFNGKISDTPEMINGMETLKNPKGTTFILPNTGGTKAYDDIYSKGLEHVKKVRPRLSWLTEELLAAYNELFAFGEQPQKSPLFENSHSNFRDSTVQNFAKYTVEGKTLTTELYQVEGALDGERTVKMIDTFSIINDDVDVNHKMNASVTVYSGSDRYTTAIDVSRNHFTKSDTVILASGEKFADSLAAASLSNKMDAPILLTRQAMLPEEVMSEIKRLQPKTVVIVGGVNAVSKAVEQELKAYEVQRIFGEDRYETAIEIAKMTWKDQDQKTAIVVSGSDKRFPDALSAGLPVHHLDAPVLFSEESDLGHATATALTDHKIMRAIVIGGNHAVSDQSEKTLKNLVQNTERIFGADRYETALKVAETFMDDSPRFILASGETFADALVASSILNVVKQPILLTDRVLSIESVNEVIKGENTVEITVIGGENAIQKIK